jgi:hypothetical protein
MRKTYSTAKVNYGSVGKKWLFTVPSMNYELRLACPGGFETATVVANALTGSVIRSKGTIAKDGTAQSAINRVTIPTWSPEFANI